MSVHSGLIDSGAQFQIMPNTRSISVIDSYKVIGTVGDHLSEQVTFKIPLTIDGHEIKNCDRRYITWKNANGDIGHDNLVFSDEDEEFLYYTWTIRDGLNVKSGLVQFAIHFEDMDEFDKNKVAYRWSTAPCGTCKVGDTLHASLGTYDPLWVSGDGVLHIGNYAPVENGILSLHLPEY